MTRASFHIFASVNVLSAILLVFQSRLADARIGSGIVELTAQTFDAFLQDNPKAMIDFVGEAGEQEQELLKSIRYIRKLGSNVPLARVDASHNADLAKRYVGCNDETQLCGSRLPQLIWFLHGEATQYHRMLRKPENIASFVLAVDRDPLKTISNESYIVDWNQVVLCHVERASSLYKTLEVVALRHMDSVAFAHIETKGGRNISWIKDERLAQQFDGFEAVEQIDDWVRGRLTLSEEAPEKPVHDGSVVVVGKTFENLVLRKDQDVMLIVYAPWCGFCRKVMPQWAKFAHSMAGLEGAPVVAKMDGTANRSPLDGFHWTTYPTIIYVRAGSQSPLIFDGERNIDMFITFAQNHSSKPFNVITDPVMLLQDPTSGKDIEL